MSIGCVDWAADDPITEPVIEAVMIGTQGNATETHRVSVDDDRRFNGTPAESFICFSGLDGDRWPHCHLCRSGLTLA
jgi:hypothetical protein